MLKSVDDEKPTGLWIKTKTGRVLIEDWSDLIPIDEAYRIPDLSRRQFDRLVESGWAPQPIEWHKYKIYIKWEIEGWTVAKELKSLTPIINKMRDKIIPKDIPNKSYVDDLHHRRYTFDSVLDQLSFCEKVFVRDDPSKEYGIYARKRDERQSEKSKEKDFYFTCQHCFHIIKYGRAHGMGATGSQTTGYSTYPIRSTY